MVRFARTGALWVQGHNRANTPVLQTMPSGWRNARMPNQRLSLRHGEDEIEVAYRTTRDGRFRFSDGTHATVHSWSATAIDVEIEGRRVQSRVTRFEDQLIVQGPRGDITFDELPRFVIPGSDDTSGGYIARMPGKVLDLRVAVGDTVSAGQTVLVLEAMKMEHPVNAPEDGVVTEVLVTQGEQVKSGTLLIVVETTEVDAE